MADSVARKSKKQRQLEVVYDKFNNMFHSKFLRKMTKRSFNLRNVVAIAICLAGVTMFSGCGGSGGGSGNSSDSGTKYENSPTGAAQEYLDYAKAGKLEKAAKCFYFKKEKTDAELKEVAKGLEMLFSKNKDYEIISEKISPDWYDKGIDKGEVMMKFIRNDGTESNTQKLNLIKVDGTWKIYGGN